MDAREIERFERNGKRWVRFNVEVKDIDTDEIVKNRFERAIIGLVDITRTFTVEPAC
jgi:hypothetical protein